MTTTATVLDHDDVIAIAGRVAAREYDSTRIDERPELSAWLRALAGMDETGLVAETTHAIFRSAHVSSLGAGWHAESCRTSAAYHESIRRHRALGHLDECRGETLYDRAWAAAAADAGLRIGRTSVCVCPDLVAA